MTEPINLQQLRDQVAKHPRSWPHDTLLALIDTAEAAQELLPNVYEHTTNAYYVHRLRITLTRFQ